MKFNSFQEKTIEALDDCSGAIKHCAKNAIRHLKKAWKIHEIDIEMAMFRGITAEEEAVSSLFHCLKAHRYQNADRLLFNQHTYKLGLFPFIEGIGHFLGKIMVNGSQPFDKFDLRHKRLGQRRAIELHLNMPGHGLIASPIPPLHFTINNAETGQISTFEKNFQELIEGAGYDNALKYIRDRAIQRNKLLYASNSGHSKVEGSIEGYLDEQKKKVMACLVIVLMIDPWEKEEGSSLFVQQALDSYLLLLQRIEQHEVTRPNNAF